jgi:esterase/lipase superfamily enzyme
MPTVHFVTNRAPNRQRRPDDFGTGFAACPASLRFGSARVDGGQVRQVDVAEEKITSTRTVLGSTAVFDELKRGMRRGLDTLCFLHGFNVTFHEALVTAAALHEAYGGTAGIQVVAFSWPSDGSAMPIVGYRRDRDDAKASGPALGRALLKLRDFLTEVRRGPDTCPARLHLIAHSMGNYVLRNGLQSYLQMGGTPSRIFDEILLMAADEDHDAFEHQHKLASLPELGGAVHVYFNRGDTALVISDRTKNNPTRLGSRGPRLPHGVPGNVTNVDCSEVVGGLLEHSYFHDSPRVVADLRAVLRGTPADQVEGRRYLPSQNRFVLDP